jgi:hypothetical protein
MRRFLHASTVQPRRALSNFNNLLRQPVLVRLFAAGFVLVAEVGSFSFSLGLARFSTSESSES